MKQVDVLPSKNQALCCKLNTAIECIVMTSRKNEGRKKQEKNDACVKMFLMEGSGL